MNRTIHTTKTINGRSPHEHTEGLLDAYIKTEKTVNSLPQLSALERVNFEQEVALGHLYYSSKIEGTHLNKERLEKAVKPQNI